MTTIKTNELPIYWGELGRDQSQFLLKDYSKLSPDDKLIYDYGKSLEKKNAKIKVKKPKVNNVSKPNKVDNTNSKYFIFTFNNYTDNTIKHIEDLFATGKFQYFIYGKEIGEQGTPHFQGYLELKAAMRLLTLVKVIGNGFHLDVRKGSQEDAIKYCRKGAQTGEDWHKDNPDTHKPYKWTHPTYGLNASVTELGEPTKLMKSGTRTDIIKIKEAVNAGGMRALYDNDHITLNQIHMAERYMSIAEKPRDFAPKFYFISGKSGFGKTTLAHNQAKLMGYTTEQIYTKSEGSKWWPGYDAHKVVILDDFRDSWMPITEFLSLFNATPKNVEYKGGSRQLKPEIIFVTTIKEAHEIYANCSGDPQIQIMRRIDRYIMLDKPQYNLNKPSITNSHINEKYDAINVIDDTKRVFVFNRDSLVDDKIQQLIPLKKDTPQMIYKLIDNKDCKPLVAKDKYTINFN